MIPNQEPPPVVHNAALRRFEARAGDAVAVLEYSMQGGRVGFDHTHVPDAFRGRGAGSALARAALTEARRRGWRVIPRCSFVADFLGKHPEFSDVTGSPSPE